MLDSNENFTLDEIKLSVASYNGDPFPGYAIVCKLSGDVLLCNCSTDLRTSVTNSLESLDEDEIGGPTVLYLIRQAIIKASSTKAEQIKDGLRKFKIKNQDGENIDGIIRMIRSAHKILEAANSVPNDEDWSETLLRLFMTSTQTEFNSIFKSWASETSREGKTPPTMDEILKTALATYQKLVDKDKWIKKNDKGSSFVNTASDDDEDATEGYNTVEKKKKGKKSNKKKKCSGSPETQSMNMINVQKPGSSRSNSRERTAKFIINGKSYEGTVSQPEDEKKPREFSCDGEKVKLWWCRLCGKTGMWKPHKTGDHESAPKEEKTGANFKSKDKRVAFQGERASANLNHPGTRFA
jgi:hypothetical protein